MLDSLDVWMWRIFGLVLLEFTNTEVLRSVKVERKIPSKGQNGTHFLGNNILTEVLEGMR